jgi:hypothetical protein
MSPVCQPAVRVDRPRRRLGVVEVALHHLRAADAQFAGLAGRRVFAGQDIDDAALGVRDSGADRAGHLPREVVRDGVGGRACLGEAVALQHAAAQPLAARHLELGGQRRGAGEHELQA